jgi:hypothetical protein
MRYGRKKKQSVRAEGNVSGGGKGLQALEIESIGLMY